MLALRLARLHRPGRRALAGHYGWHDLLARDAAGVYGG
jgi:hypothetical protein